VRDSVTLNENNQYTLDSLSESKVENSIFMVSKSTCNPCMKAKQLFDSYGVHYENVDIDIDMLEDFMSGRGISMVYPMMIVKGRKLIQGYDEKTLHALARELVLEEEQ